MNIEQQRKSFDEWVLKHPDNLDLTAYEENIMFDAWLAAQQQEGYVMVPIEPTGTMLRAIETDSDYVFSVPFGYENAPIDKDAAREIYKAMIQAVQE